MSQVFLTLVTGNPVLVNWDNVLYATGEKIKYEKQGLPVGTLYTQVEFGESSRGCAINVFETLEEIVALISGSRS